MTSYGSAVLSILETILTTLFALGSLREREDLGEVEGEGERVGDMVVRPGVEDLDLSKDSYN